MDESFLLHNVDVISTIDLRQLLESQAGKGALATLAVQPRVSSRQLLFDAEGELSGRWINGQDPEFVRSIPNLVAYGFTGIHAISPRLLPLITEDGAFSIIDTYLRLATEGQRILAFRADNCYWRDLGKLDDLRHAENEFAAG